MDPNLAQLSSTLASCLSPDPSVRRPAEEFLRKSEEQQNYGVMLITLLGQESADPTAMMTKTSGAIAFKNYIKRKWKVQEDGDDQIHPADRDAIKTLIVELMLKSPLSIQKQLSASIAIIGQEDFPMKWPSLIKDMTDRFATGDFHMINGVLQTASSIFEKYSYKMKSQKLWEEIKFVLDNFAQSFTNLFGSTMQLAKEHANNQQALQVIYSSLGQIAKIFYYLNYQDLPEHFEDNMAIWMPLFHELLTNSPKLTADDDDEPGVIEELKSQICDNIGLYAHKYEEEFSPYMQQYVTAVWNLLLTVGPQTKFDLLASNAIQFLASVAHRQQYKQLFEDPATLGSICEKIIVPNIEMREIDSEQFEDNPEEYIRRDLEGSDVDTRRRAACDLVKGLSSFFLPQITSIFGSYIGQMMTQYAADPKGRWPSKDAAIYLVTSLATKAKTAKHGITQTNELVNLVDFANQYILPELTSAGDANSSAVLKADAIKYIMTFKAQLPPEMVLGALPHIINFLSHDSHVVHTYAAAAIDKILLVKVAGTNNPLVTKELLTPHADALLRGLFGAFSLSGSAENEYVMKAVMRCFSALQESVIPFLGDLLPALTDKLRQAAKNPTKPHYNHYLFEALSLSIRIVCKSQPGAVANFETVLFPVFQEILQQDVQEFVPYSFQVLSMLLELHDKTVPEPYMQLFSFLLMPVLWERSGNITPLTRLLQSYISKGTPQILALGKTEAILGVFQKLIASKSNDHEGFHLMQSIVEHFPAEVMSQYTKPVFSLLFQRLTSSKTTKFVKHLIVFMMLYAVKYNGAALIEVVDSLQANMFGMVCDRLIVAEVQKVSGGINKKIAAVGMTRMLCETPAMIDGQYSQYWTPLLQALVGLFELPEDETATADADERFHEHDDSPGYQTAYSVLIFASSASQKFNPVANVPDVRLHLAQNLGKLAQGRPGMLVPLVGGMQPQAKAYLEKYLQMAGVAL